MVKIDSDTKKPIVSKQFVFQAFADKECRHKLADAVIDTKKVTAALSLIHSLAKKSMKVEGAKVQTSSRVAKFGLYACICGILENQEKRAMTLSVVGRNPKDCHE